MKILFAVKVEDEDWQEVVITEVESRIPDASEWALANGYNRLRIADIDLAEPPKFGANLLA